jgi:S-adenosylmethionine-diacylglycerol 3-amino-3-carboxypropyl transferase
VVREDPETESFLFRKYRIRSAAMIGSGGCTALSLQSRFPETRIHLIEPNPAQVRVIRRKMAAMNSASPRERKAIFGIGAFTSTSLIESGNFEALFRRFRDFLEEFVISRQDFLRLLKKSTVRDWQAVFTHPYWTVAFELHFADPLLLTMFGPAAIQHAPPESYPKHFRSVLEKGLLRADRAENYFLHHVFLGHYLDRRSAWPLYLAQPPKNPHFTFTQGVAQAVEDYSGFDFVGLSNIFDWSSSAEVRALASRLARELQPGAVVLYRQLNHSQNFEGFFGPDFRWLRDEARKLHQQDRSLFYSSFHIARKLR